LETIDLTETDIALGQRVRAKRHELNLTLDELATRSGVARTTISKIERDLISPSFNTLAKVARGMGLKITQIISEEETDQPIVVRKKDRVRLELNGSKCTVEDLTGNLENMQLEVVELTLQAGQDTGVDLAHPGEEFLLCQQGTVELQIGGERYKLKKGDSIQFKSTRSTCLSNPGDSKARVLWVYFPPPGAKTSFHASSPRRFAS
jgi:transcriptional regulator with XRE-family HTH domain